MSRLTELRRFAGKDILGLEVAPYFNPIVTKAAGYRVMILDVFDTDRLRANALADPLIPDHRVGEIEPVDIVSDASRLEAALEAQGVAGQFGYIVSSHNFEHLPDPIRFLRGCEVALRPGGVLTMAIPDYRACFDHFRLPTRLADWLSAYHRGHGQPAPETLFDNAANRSFFYGRGQKDAACDIGRDSPAGFRPEGGLREAYEAYLRDLADPGAYRDAHCSMMFGASFELMLRDLVHLGLVGFEVIEVTATRGHEFFVHLRKPEAGMLPQEEAGFAARRTALMRQVNAELGAAGFRDGQGFRGGITRLLGPERIAALRGWNRARRARRKAQPTAGAAPDQRP